MKILGGMLIIFSIAACSEFVDCSRETKTTAKISFFKKADGTSLEIAFDTITAIGTDSIFFTAKDTLNIYDIPLDPNSISTTFIFIKASVTDTLNLGYENQFVIIDEDCPPEIAFNNLEILNTSFDSLKIVESRLLIEVENNIEIFL